MKHVASQGFHVLIDLRMLPIHILLETLAVWKKQGLAHGVYEVSR